MIHRIRIPLPDDFSGKAVNCFFLEGRPKTLIDAGVHNEAAKEALAVGLNLIGHGVEEIEQLVLTHAHIDHIGLANWIVRQSGCRVYGSADSLSAIRDFPRVWSERLQLYSRAAVAAGTPDDIREEFETSFRQRQRLGPPPLDLSGLAHLLAPGRALRAGDRSWKVHHFPGHAPDHLVLHDRKSEVAISGDLLLRGTPTLPMLEGRDAAGKRPQTMADLIESLRAFSRLEIRHAHVGHGPMVRAHRLLIAQRLADIRAALILHRRQLGREEQSLWETIAGLSEQASDGRRLHIELSRVVAHLDWLVDKGLVKRRVIDGRLMYRRP